MGHPLDFFVELAEPESMSSLGWYVRCEDIHGDYYLHDDGIVYDTCAPRFDTAGGNQISTGWYVDEISAVLCCDKYYNKHGLIYPYTNSIPTATPATNNIESKVMEFE